MKFDVALKEVKVGETAGRLYRTDRLYACSTCRKVTGWRVDAEECPGHPMCSDECLDAWDAFCASEDAELIVPFVNPEEKTP